MDGFDKDGLLKGLGNAKYQQMFDAWKHDKLVTAKWLMIIAVILGVLALLFILYRIFLADDYSLSGVVGGALLLVCVLFYAFSSGTRYEVTVNPEYHFISDLLSSSK
ncbi:hypothetical protein [Schleiferilactobacillus harbinensis]|uniref:Uncharacterized protein n=1 Tax=Schleiferilactobacillus harbinensis TaxID=304207 RepID=A0A5P8M3N5_9LACO|nr:hypothetical protein [Schleiferilactobacillus harbinensis]QFR23100.1 hypothetical protein D1010_06600 [Schleiferilactobacillus harbinensis]